MIKYMLYYSELLYAIILITIFVTIIFFNEFVLLIFTMKFNNIDNISFNTQAIGDMVSN